MELRGVKKYSYEQLSNFTNKFSQENCLGEFQFGEVYRGEIEEGKHVMLKIWGVPEIYRYYPGDNILRLTDDILLLQHEKFTSQPGMVKLCGYCCDDDGHFAAVYDIEPLDILFRLIPTDNFTWLQRIKVAFGFACLVKFFHTDNPEWKPFIIRNISAAHIAVDKDYNAKLFDFSMISGGIFPDRASIAKDNLRGCCGYIDLRSSSPGQWSYGSDVFQFGMLLLNLISKKVYTGEAGTMYPDDWAFYECERQMESGIQEENCVLVHESLLTDPDYCDPDGRKISKLAMDCIDWIPAERPSMKKVVECFLEMQVVKDHVEYIGTKSLLDTTLSTI